MHVPLAVTFRGLEKDPAIEDLIYEQAAKLDHYCDHVNSCRVAIEKLNTAQRRGQPTRVRIDVTVAPRHELIVRREPSHGNLHFPLSTVIRRAFRAMQRQITELTDRQQGRVKNHHREITPEERAHKLDAGENYREEG